MKNSFFLALPFSLLVLTACQTTGGTKAVPADTSAKPIQSHCSPEHHTTAPPSTLLGYGSSSTLHGAKQLAYRDIAEQIKVKVESRSHILNRKSGESVSQEYESRIDSFATAELDDLAIECIDRHSDGNTYVVLAYDMRPLGVRLADRLSQHLGYRPSGLVLDGPRALTQGRIVSELQQSLAKTGQGTTHHATLSLLRRNNRWQLGVDDLYTPLDDSQLTDLINWSTLRRGDISLAATSPSGHPLPGIIKNETEFRLQVRSQHNGYLHLLAIYENGEVAVLRNDIKTSGGNTHVIPEDDGVFEAGLFDANKQAVDIYLALVTVKPLNDSGLSLVSSNRETENRHLATLLGELERANGATAVLSVTITPR